jgi:DNA-binding protein YbaB
MARPGGGGRRGGFPGGMGGMGGGGGGGGLPPGFDPEKMLGPMKAQLEDLEKQLGERTTDGASGGGKVSVVASAALEVRSFKIDPSVVPAPGDQGGKEMLEDLVAAAVNAALKKAKVMREEAQAEFQQKQIQQMLGGLGGAGGLDLGKLLGGM